MKKIVILGGGGHAKVVASILKKLIAFEIVGYADKEDRGSLLGIPYLGSDEALVELKERCGQCAAVLGVGYLGNSNLREQLVESFNTLFLMPAVVSPQAVINEDVVVGDGTVVMDGVIVNSGTRIGKYVIINTRASIDHDCEVGDFVHIAPGAIVCGGVKVGAHSLVGAGAIVVQYKTIGERCMIGAGAVVVKDCIEPGTYVGVPAKKL